jgi:ABC-type polysaccharide/polyol phosphate export permease
MTAPAKVWTYRTLITNLALRDLRSRYKKSILGWLWSLINPAVTLGIYTVVFGIFLKQNANALTAGNHTTKSFALYLFCALTVWNAFANGINQSITSFLAAGPMLTRTYFPPECPVFAGTLTTLTQTVIESSILLGFMVVLGNVGWSYLLVPAIVILLTAFTFGLGMLVSLLNVRYRDINYLVGIGLQVLFYATPIVYRVDSIGGHPLLGLNPRHILDFNPMTHFVEAIRDVTYFQQAPSIRNWLVMVGSAVVSVGFGWWLFDRKSPQLIEEI